MLLCDHVHPSSPIPWSPPSLPLILVIMLNDFPFWIKYLQSINLTEFSKINKSNKSFCCEIQLFFSDSMLRNKYGAVIFTLLFVYLFTVLGNGFQLADILFLKPECVKEWDLWEGFSMVHSEMYHRKLKN
jgi:hypothetical protein